MEYNSTPWKDILIDTRDYTVYRDKYPVTEGHILFVPKEQTFEAIQTVSYTHLTLPTNREV